MIEVSLLGPPRVERDGVLVAFDTRKAVALLALLAVSDRSRTRDSLADLLWPGNDTAHARGALRRTLSALRAAIGVELIEATSDHVRLVKGPGVTIDIDRFRDLRAQGDLEAAVAVFRGDFLEGFAVQQAPEFEDWVQVEGEGLRQELTATLATLTEDREAAGNPVGALTSARRWLAVDPLHEPAHRALMRLYATTGDRAAALTQYRECVRTLLHELGVRPLKETTELYDAINRGSYVTLRPVATPGAAPDTETMATPFVGREEDLGALRAVYDTVDADGRVVLVEGEAGIGKTRLAEELLSWVRRHSGRVLVGRAYEDEIGLAYAPVVEALRGRLPEGDDWLAGVDDRARNEAARLVPELGTGRADEAPLRPWPEAETRFLSGVWDTLLGAANGSAPGALFIDDVQWADEATLGLVTYGLRRLAGRPLLVVLTWRTPLDHPLRRTVATVTRGGGGAVLHLDRLDENVVETLVRATQRGDPDPTVARRLFERSEGVPLLLVEYLRTSGTRGEAELPTGVRDLLLGRLDPVSETGRQVLSAAAVLGRAFDVGSVRAVSGRTEEETVTALEEVVRRGLVYERRADYDFAHDLLRVLVYDETSLARRRLLHGRAARLPGTAPASMARHLQLAGRGAEAARAFRTAGERAREVFANVEALDHFRTALALGHPDRAGLQTAIGDLQTMTGDYAGALRSFMAAAADCDPGEVAPLEQRLGRLRHREGEYALAEAHLETALAAASDEDPARRASITADLSLAAQARGDTHRAQLLARRARTLAEEAGDLRTLCQAHNLLGMLATAQGDTATAVGSLRQAGDLAEQAGDRDLQIAALNNLALAHRTRRELDQAIELTLAALELCTAMGDRHHEAALHNNLADLLHASDRSEEAMAHLKTAVEIFAEIGAPEEPRAGIWQMVQW